MQFRTKNFFDLFDFTSFFAWTILNFLAYCATSYFECVNIFFISFSELLTTCDYHSVGLRAVAYTELSVKVAQTSQLYARKLVEHLIEQKISHWDNSVRELTGQALRKLAPITPG